MANPVYNLSEQEQKIMNYSTMQIDEDVKLGDTVQEILDEMVPAIMNMQIEEGTPVNAVAATATLNINGVVIDGETVTITNPDTAAPDVYEFCADEALSVTVEGNIPVDITSHVVFSTGTLTMDTQPTSGNTVTLGTKLYTWVPIGTATADGEIDVGADLAAAKVNFVAAVNGTDGVSDPHPLVEAAEFVVHACAITALIGGVAGDAIATTETFSAGTNIFAAGNLGGGADCTAADAVTELVAAILAEDTQGVGAADGAGNTVVLTALLAGAWGNDIAIEEDMANGAFAGAAVTLEGGVDGTVAEVPKLMVDNTWLYVCFSDNTVNDANWRRIALGNVY